MANRFLETNYYKSPYVRSLKGALKGLYSFIICDCTPSGIWAKDMEAASLYIGFPVTETDFEEYFIKKDKAIPINSGKFFFPDFIEHQYPSGLHDDNKAHKNIISELKKLNFLIETKVEKKTKEEVKTVSVFFVKDGRGFKGALKELNSPPIGTQGIGNGNVLGKVIKEFNNYPNGESGDLELPEIYYRKAIEYLDINKQIRKTKGQISVIWDVFKLENFTGKNYYADESKIFTHFIRTLKNEKTNSLQQILNQTTQPKIKL